MSQLRTSLWRRGEASSFLVRSSSLATSTTNRRSNCDSKGGRRRGRKAASVMTLDMLGQEVDDDSGVISSPVTCAGVFVSPNTVLAALTTSEFLMSSEGPSKGPSLLSSCGTSLLGVVITAEVGGWLRVRDQRNGSIRYQRRLPSLSDPSCMCWVRGLSSSSSCRGFFVGQQCGLVTMMQLFGETINHVADCVLHEAPVTAMTCVQLSDDVGGSGPSNETHDNPAQEVLVTLDTSGLLVVWDTAALRCIHTAQLQYGCSARCLASGRSVLGSVFIPGRVTSELPTTSTTIREEKDGADDGGSRIAFDVVLARCPGGSTSAWEEIVTYGGAETTVISMAIVQRMGGSSDTLHSTLWCGTAGGVLHMWDVSSGTSLRVVREITPSRFPIHYISCHPCFVGPGYVWVCTRGGTVTVWDANRLLMLSELPVSYPKGPPVGPNDIRSCSNGGDAHFLRHLVDDVSEAAGHFTLFIGPIEPVLTLRLWSAATDGTVRSWLCHTSLSGVSTTEDPCITTTTTNATAAPPYSNTNIGRDTQDGFIDKREVRRFIVEKAKMFVCETTALHGQVSKLSGEVSALQARNRILADGLKEAIARIDEGSGDKEVEGTTPPPADSPPPREPPLLQLGLEEGAANVDSMRATLQELHGRLQDAFADKERLLADRMALLLKLNENTSRLDTMRELRNTVSLSALPRYEVAIQHESREVRLLRDQLSHSKMEGSMYMRRWEEEQRRRVTAEEERDACRKRLIELEDKLHCMLEDSSRMPPVAAFTSTEDGYIQREKGGKGGCTTAGRRVPENPHGGAEHEVNSSLKTSACDYSALDVDTGVPVSGASPHGLAEVRFLQEGQQQLAADTAEVLCEMQWTWAHIKESREEIIQRAACVRRMQQQLLNKEAALIVHAERLRALEEELRQKERHLMQQRHADRLES